MSEIETLEGSQPEAALEGNSEAQPEAALEGNSEAQPEGALEGSQTAGTDGVMGATVGSLDAGRERVVVTGGYVMVRAPAIVIRSRERGEIVRVAASNRDAMIRQAQAVKPSGHHPEGTLVDAVLIDGTVKTRAVESKKPALRGLGGWGSGGYL